MSDFDFNPRPRDEKGVGQVKLGGETEEAGVKAGKGGASAKWIAGGIAGVTALGLVAIFTLAGGGADVAPQPVPVEKQVERPRPARPDPAPVTRVQSVEAKMAAIYRNDNNVYRDQTGARGEIYINDAGRGVRAGEDFAVHASLFGRGGISVLIAQGPYAGARVGFFPDHPAYGDARVTYEVMGVESAGPDGRPVFSLLPAAERSAQAVAMARPDLPGRTVTLAPTARQVEKTARESGRELTAFIVSGEPERDGKFSVQIWNGDRYSFDLSTGDYFIDSAFLANIDYERDFELTGREVIPAKVGGRMTLQPAMRQTPAQPRL